MMEWYPLSIKSIAEHYINYENLGSTHHCHQDLTGYDEWDLSRNVLRGQ